MAEPKIETVVETVDTTVASPSRFQGFRLNHPRSAKVIGIAAVTLATLGVVQVWKNRNQEDSTEVDDSNDSFDTSSEIA